MRVVRCDTADMRADFFTKFLGGPVFEKHWQAISGAVHVEVNHSAVAKLASVAIGSVDFDYPDWMLLS